MQQSYAQVAINLIVWCTVSLQAAEKKQPEQIIDKDLQARAVAIFAGIEIKDTEQLQKLRIACRKIGAQVMLESSMNNVLAMAVATYESLPSTVKKCFRCCRIDQDYDRGSCCGN